MLLCKLHLFGIGSDLVQVVEVHQPLLLVSIVQEGRPRLELS
jgi:hypothetical protein